MKKTGQGQTWQGASANSQNIEGRLTLIDPKMTLAIATIALVERVPFEAALAVLAGWGAGYWEGGGIPRDVWDVARARQVDAARGRDAQE